MIILSSPNRAMRPNASSVTIICVAVESGVLRVVVILTSWSRLTIDKLYYEDSCCKQCSGEKQTTNDQTAVPKDPRFWTSPGDKTEVATFLPWSCTLEAVFFSLKWAKNEAEYEFVIQLNTILQQLAVEKNRSSVSMTITLVPRHLVLVVTEGFRQGLFLKALS